MLREGPRSTASPDRGSRGVWASRHPVFSPMWHFPSLENALWCRAVSPSAKLDYLSISKAWRRPRPLEGGLTRYISTRGEAPALGFCDVMLAGLARDGGLYVPEVWPQLSPGNHRRIFRPALLGSRGRGDPPVRRRRDFRCRSRPHGQRGLRHVPPSCRRPARSGRSQSIRAGAVSRPDAGVQGRGDATDLAADGSRAGASARSAPPSWSRPLAIPAAPRSMRSRVSTMSI